jgi:hypothetical protein
MKFKLLLTIAMLLLCSSAYCQLSKEETLKYINDVYKESYTGQRLDEPISVTLHYQNLVIMRPSKTTSTSLKDSIIYYKTNDGFNHETWTIGRSNENILTGISSEDNCKRLYKALLHLQAFVRQDPASKDPFSN